MAQTKVKLISDGVIVQGNLHASHGITTAHIGEGSNLYYTDARVGSYLSTNSFATESYVGTQITNLVDSSPATLNTLNELAAALGDDPNFATTTATSIGLKAPLASPTFTGNATFAGSITSTGLNVNAGTYHKVIATFPATYTTNLQIGQQFNVNNDALTDTVTFAHTGTEAASDFIFTVAGNEKLKIQGNGNATFAGQVSVGNYAIPSDHQFQIAHLGQSYARFALTNSQTGNATGDGLKFQMENLNAIIKNQENGFLGFGTNGRESDIRIDSSGNVIIGNTNVDNPNSLDKVLEIEHGGSVGVILNDSRDTPIGLENRGAVFHLTHNTNSRLVVDGASGNVGIGTGSDTPENRLHIRTNTTDASSQLMLQNGSTGDASIKFNISGQSYVIGIDNSDSNKFKISGSSALGTTDRFVIDSSGNSTFAGNVTTDKLVIDGASNSNVSQLALTRTDYSWGIFNETNLRFYVQSGNTTTPNGQVLEIATNGNATFAGDIKINNSTPYLLNNDDEILTGSDAGGYYFALVGSGNSSKGVQIGDHNSYIRFDTDGGERMRIDSSGLTTIKRTGITGVAKADMTLQIGYEGNNGQNNLIGFGYNAQTNIPAYIGYTTTSGSGSTKGDLVFGTRSVTTNTAPSERMRITSGGNVGIGETSPGSKLTVRKDSAGGRGGEISIVNYASNTIGNEAALNFGLESSTYHADFGNAQIKATVMAANAASDMVFSTWNGSSFGQRMRITSAGTIFMYGLGGYTSNNADVRYATSSSELYYQTSSKRYKTDIVNLENSLNKINSLRPVRYVDINTNEPACGLIAEETVEVIPEVVFTKEIEGFDEPQVEGINYSDIVPFLIKSIQELKADNDSLKARIETLENK